MLLAPIDKARFQTPSRYPDRCLVAISVILLCHAWSNLDTWTCKLLFELSLTTLSKHIPEVVRAFGGACREVCHKCAVRLDPLYANSSCFATVECCFRAG